MKSEHQHNRGENKQHLQVRHLNHLYRVNR